MHRTPEVEIFKFDAEIQMETKLNCVGPEIEYPDAWTGLDELESGIAGSDGATPCN